MGRGGRENWLVDQKDKLTIRDQFAMVALTGLLADCQNWDYDKAPDFAKGAYAFADAMLEARKK